MKQVFRMLHYIYLLSFSLIKPSVAVQYLCNRNRKYLSWNVISTLLAVFYFSFWIYSALFPGLISVPKSKSFFKDNLERPSSDPLLSTSGLPFCPSPVRPGQISSAVPPQWSIPKFSLLFFFFFCDVWNYFFFFIFKLDQFYVRQGSGFVTFCILAQYSRGAQEMAAQIIWQYEVKDQS